MRGVADRIGQDDLARRAEINVAQVEVKLVVGGEIVSQRKAADGGEFQDAVAVVAVGGIPVAVAGFEVKVPGRIGGGTASGLPKAAPRPIRIGVENAGLSQRVGVVSKDPTVIRRIIEVAGKRNINIAVEEQKGGPLVMFQLNKRHVSLAVVAIAHSRHSALDERRPAELLRPGGNI